MPLPTTREKLRRFDEALAAYEQVIQLDPRNAVAYHKKDLTLEKLGALTKP